jgi:hypothetical protein
VRRRSSARRTGAPPQRAQPGRHHWRRHAGIDHVVRPDLERQHLLQLAQLCAHGQQRQVALGLPHLAQQAEVFGHALGAEQHCRLGRAVGGHGDAA